ncbi:MAG TPA: M14 family metallopeptidase [Casimicrobiaceae bacterium]|nr:M14 family metallopeptidase [Casimicrobiaceae bacterium]
MTAVHAGFAATYAQAREKFLAAAAKQGAAIQHDVLTSHRGCQGEELAIDAALLGHGDASSLLLISSGTHGIEGFCGSGAQVALLSDDALVREIAACDVAVLFVHAVNPYGFSWLRRANEDNVDLNRNFRDFAQPLPVNAEYARLHPHILPPTWPPAAEHEAVLHGYIARHGIAGLQAVISSGQYQFADGLFYGGNRPAWSNARIRALLREHGRERRRLAWIDFHSGLGPQGHGEKIYAGHDDARELARARAWWGADVTSFHEGSSVSAALTGAMYVAAYEECPGIEYTGIALEFGTVPLPEVFGALRAEQWLHNHPGSPLAQRAAVNAAMRRAFYSETAEWQDAVVNQGRTAVLAALTNLRMVR